MKNSLRKRLKKLLSEYDLKFISITVKSRFLISFSVKYNICSYLKLKYEHESIFLLYDYKLPSSISHTDVMDALLKDVELDSDDYQTMIQPILDILVNLNPKTYKFDKHELKFQCYVERE